jgi:hypothetical protein
MIAALVLFRNDEALTLADATARFNSTAPSYAGLAGLRAKAYLYAEDGQHVGGFYFWESRAAAEALYTDAWRERVRQVYGTEPVIRYFEIPVVVMNQPLEPAAGR